MIDAIERFCRAAASPYRVDIASFAPETRHGPWMAQVRVRPMGVSKERRTFGTRTYQHFTEAEARFTDLLPVEDSEGEAAGMLH